MKMLALLAGLAMFLFAIPQEALADDTWVCAYQLGQAPVLYRLIVKGHVLTVENADPFLIEAGPFQVLRDDVVSLVAVYISPAWQSAPPKPLLGTQTLLIDKRTGAHAIVTAYLGEPLEASTGTCLKQ